MPLKETFGQIVALEIIIPLFKAKGDITNNF